MDGLWTSFAESSEFVERKTLFSSSSVFEYRQGIILKKCFNIRQFIFVYDNSVVKIVEWQKKIEEKIGYFRTLRCRKIVIFPANWWKFSKTTLVFI